MQWPHEHAVNFPEAGGRSEVNIRVRFEALNRLRVRWVYAPNRSPAELAGLPPTSARIQSRETGAGCNFKSQSPPAFRALQAEARKLRRNGHCLPGIILLRTASAQHVRQVSPLRRGQVSSADLQRLRKIPMATVTTIFDPLTPHPVKTVCYECQKCGDTLGSPRLRRHRVVLPLSRSTSPA